MAGLRRKKRNRRGGGRRSIAKARVKAVEIALARDWLRENPGADKLPPDIIHDLNEVGLDAIAIEQMLKNERKS